MEGVSDGTGVQAGRGWSLGFGHVRPAVMAAEIMMITRCAVRGFLVQWCFLPEWTGLAPRYEGFNPGYSNSA
jgi:hypothetical protein